MAQLSKSTLVDAFLLLFTSLLMLVATGLMGTIHAQVAVPDSIYGMQSLGYEDLLADIPDETRQIFGANRLSENVDELPLRAYIISREEITRNGYTTLGDVLKNVPGFRVSQPGEALLGETFVMRGLVGNLYTKILINGIPLDPSAAKGMPLAAFLPIRQAKRIEIILGPASSLYGPDALAGVINIVLPTIERPVEAMGSVALGNHAAVEMHLALGGKMGNGKNILNYMIYGSSRQIDNISLQLPDDLIEIDSMSPALGSDEFHAAEDSSRVPKVDEFPHQSRLIGVSLSYRGLSFNSNALFRTDNVAIGAFPEDISYDFPHGEIVDRIYANRLRYEKTLGRLSLRTNLSSVVYEIDDQSEYRGIAHPISSGINHIYASSRDILAEQLAFYQLNNKVLFMGGISYNRNVGDAFQGYLARPFGSQNVIYDSIRGIDVIENSADDFSAIEKYSSFDTYVNNEFGAFAQVNYQTEKFRVTTGGRLDRDWNGEYRFSPKVGATYKIGKGIRLRSFYGQAFRAPPVYNRFNNYVEREILQPRVPPLMGMDTVVRLIRIQVPLQYETLRSIEGGAVFEISKSLRAEVHFFRHVLTNSILPSLQFSQVLGEDIDPPTNPNPQDTVAGNNLFGFFNANSKSTLNAFQAFINYESRIIDAELYGQYNIGREAIEDLDTVDAYRSQPRFMGQANLHVNIPRVLRISIYSQWFSNFTWGLAKVNSDILVKDADSYYNIDLAVSRDFTPRFLGYFRMTNVMNSISRGIFTTDVSGYQFDYLPQQQRMFTVGLTYHL